MANGNFKDSARRTVSDEVLRDKAFNIATDSKYDGYQRGLAFMFTNFLIKSLQTVVLICMQIIRLNKISVLWTWLRIN